MERKRISHQAAKNFITAGKSTLTIESKPTGKHFTFKFITPIKDLETGKTLAQLPTWVRILNNGDNTSKFAFLGTLWSNRYVHSKKSYTSEDAQSVKALKFYFNALFTNNEKNLNLIDVYHEGSCARCGRKLTTPESIERGIGPICDDLLERLNHTNKVRSHQIIESSTGNKKLATEENAKVIAGILG